MKKSLTFLATLLAVLGVSNFNNSVQGEPYIDSESESIQEVFRRAFNYNSGGFFFNTSYAGQFRSILGYDGFPENQVIKDTEILEILMRDYQEQVTEEEPLRTRDLDNPYQGSLREDPDYYSPFSP